MFTRRELIDAAFDRLTFFGNLGGDSLTLTRTVTANGGVVTFSNLVLT